MPANTYTRSQKAEAVALAGLVGAKEAARRLGMTDHRAILRWRDEAGAPPELEGTAEDWQRFYDVARAKVQSDLVAGRIRGNALTTFLGIATDKLSKLARETPVRPSKTDVERAVDPVIGWLDATYGRDADRALAYLVRALSGPEEDCVVEPEDWDGDATAWARRTLDGVDFTATGAVVEQHVETLGELLQRAEAYLEDAS